MKKIYFVMIFVLLSSFCLAISDTGSLEINNLELSSLKAGDSEELVNYNMKIVPLAATDSDDECLPDLGDLTYCSLTESLTLTPGNYIVTGSIEFLGDNIVLDCNGATIEYPEPYALLYSKYNDNITIKNCNLIPFGTGISLKGRFSWDHSALAKGIYLINNTILRTSLHCGYETCLYASAKVCVASCNQGIYLENVSNAHISGNSIINTRSYRYAMQFWNLHDSIIDGNYVHGVKGNDLALIYSTNTTIRNEEHVNPRRYASIYVFNSSGNTFEYNTFYYNPPIFERDFSIPLEFDYGDYDYWDDQLLYNITEDMQQRDYPGSTAIWIEHSSGGAKVRYNHIYNWSGVGIYIEDVNTANVSYNYIHNIADDDSYWPWEDNYPDGIEFDTVQDSYIGYNYVTKVKKHGIALWDSDNIIVEKNHIPSNNFLSNNSYGNFHLKSSTDVTFRYNNMDTDGECWPGIEDESYCKIEQRDTIIEDTIWNRNANQTWSEGILYPGPFTNEELLIIGKGAIDASLNWFGSTDQDVHPEPCLSSSCGDKLSIPERIDDIDDWKGYGKVYFEPFLTEPVEMFCEQDNDGDGHKKQQVDTFDVFWCNNESDCVDTIKDCVDYNGNSYTEDALTYCESNLNLIYPEATEICNGVDDDCNGIIDENAIPNAAKVCHNNNLYWQDSCGNTQFNDTQLYNLSLMPDGFIRDECDDLPGDADLDGDVDLDDFMILKINFGSTDASWEQADFDGDSDVDLDDFMILKINFGRTV